MNQKTAIILGVVVLAAVGGYLLLNSGPELKGTAAVEVGWWDTANWTSGVANQVTAVILKEPHGLGVGDTVLLSSGERRKVEMVRGGEVWLSGPRLTPAQVGPRVGVMR